MQLLHKACCLLLIVCIPFLAKSQITIHGFVKDLNGSAISNAVIILHNIPDNSILKTEISDSLGFYSLTYPDLNHTLVEVNALGFENKNYYFEDENKSDIQLDFLLKKQVKQLEEVVVSQEKPLFERRVDRTIFNVTQSISSIGSDALHVLEKAPGVIVNPLDNNIQLAGKGQINVMINGRLLQLTGEDLVAYLKSIPADNIQHIEVITTPPAKYGASGNSGLIDIILKKNIDNGFNAILRASYAQASYGKIMGGGNLNFRKNKWNIYTNIDYSKSKNNITERLNTPYSSQSMYMTNGRLRTLKPLSYMLGLDYEVHTNGILGFVWMGNDLKREDNEHIINRLFTNGITDSLMNTTGDNLQNNKNNSLNINYDWKIDTSGKKLSVNINKLWFSGNSKKDFETHHYLGEFLIPTGIKTKNRIGGNQNIGITTVQVDMELPYKWAFISFGGKLSFIENKSNNFFQYFKDNQYFDDPNISSEFDYSEDIQAIYVNAQRTWRKWEIQIGWRGEFTQTRGLSISFNELNTHHYFQLFPSAFLLYKMNENNMFNINYTKRIRRPGYKELDPFRAYSSPYFYSQGDPFLQPFFNHNMELSYNFRYKYFLSVFYQIANNSIGGIWMTDDLDKVTYMKSGNYFNTRNFGLSVMGNFRVFHFWELQAQGYFSYQHLNSTYYPQFVHSSIPYYYLHTNSTFSFNTSKTLMAEVNAYYSGKSQMGFFIWEPVYSMSAGIKTLLFDKKLSLSLSVHDIFNSTAGRKAKNQITHQAMNNDLDYRNVSINASFRFGNHKIKSARNRKTGIEDEEGRM